MSIEEKAGSLYFALFESKTRDKNILDLILSTERSEREQIRKAYDRKYPSNNCLDDLKKKLGGDFKETVVKTFQTRAEYDAETLYNAFKGFSIDEDPIYEIVIGRPPQLLDEIKPIYEKKAGVSLEANIKKHFPNPLKKNLAVVLNTKRSTNPNPSHDFCQKQADKLINTAPDNWLNDNEIINMLAKNSPEELVLTSRYYLKKTNQHIMKTIEGLSKSQKKYIMAILFNVVAPPEMYANKINEAIKGLGTDDPLLQRIVVTRYDIDMTLIKKYYRQNYKVTARADIEDDTSGLYRDLLVGLINKYDPNDY